jgi:hypothetical protein
MYSYDTIANRNGAYTFVKKCVAVSLQLCVMIDVEAICIRQVSVSVRLGVH